MNRILYPTPGTKGDSPPKSNNHRASAQAGDDDRDPSSDTRAGGSGASIIGHVSNGFEGLTPLEMVEKITKMAEAKMTVSQGKLLRTHTVDPATTAAATSSYADETAGGVKKRGRNANTTDPNNNTMPSPAPLLPWDLSFLIRTDPDPSLACMTANKLGALASRIETSPNYFLCSPSYKRLQDELAASCQLIHAEHGNSPATRRSLLVKLYTHTVQKMETLAMMMKDIQPPSGPTILPINATSTDADVSAGRDGPPSSSHSRRDKPSKKKKGGDFSKRDFASYMEKWLRDNWTNPYPDDDGLAEIAEDCDTTPTVVSNWLINARTRKWRPAIIKAYDHGRPADTLMEDAVNIFQDLPLRKLGDDVPYFDSPSLGRVKKAGKGKGKSKSKK